MFMYTLKHAHVSIHAHPMLIRTGFRSGAEALRLTEGPRTACNVEPLEPERPVATTRTRLSVLALMQNHPRTQG